jgi:hypothetical protein
VSTTPPTVEAIASKGRDHWILEFTCPWCPKRRGKPATHIHGGGPLTDWPDGGHRVSHCHAAGAPDGYFLNVTNIVEVEAA